MYAGCSAPGPAGPLCAGERSSESSAPYQRCGRAVRRSVPPADAPHARPAASAKRDTELWVTGLSSDSGKGLTAGRKRLDCCSNPEDISA